LAETIVLGLSFSFLSSSAVADAAPQTVAVATITAAAANP